MRIRRKTLPVADRLRGALAQANIKHIQDTFYSGKNIPEFDKKHILEGNWGMVGAGFENLMTRIIAPLSPGLTKEKMDKVLLRYGVVLLHELNDDKMGFFMAQIKGEWFVMANILGTEEVKVLGQVVKKSRKKTKLDTVIEVGKRIISKFTAKGKK